MATPCCGATWQAVLAVDGLPVKCCATCFSVVHCRCTQPGIHCTASTSWNCSHLFVLAQRLRRWHHTLVRVLVQLVAPTLTQLACNRRSVEWAAAACLKRQPSTYLFTVVQRFSGSRSTASKGWSHMLSCRQLFVLFWCAGCRVCLGTAGCSFSLCIRPDY